jgi:hypothetical protein
MTPTILKRGLVCLPLLACTFLSTGLQRAVAQRGSAQAWTRITETTGRNIDEVALARTPDGVLHIAWLRKNGNNWDLVHTALGEKGEVIGSPSAILASWSTLTNPALIATKDSGLRAFFGGLRSTNTKDPYSGGLLYTATAGAGGASWQLQEGATAKSSSVYSDTVGVTLAPDGKPVTAWAPNSPSFHFGLDPGQPDHRFQTACCAYYPNLATDAKSSEVVLGWFSNAGHDHGLWTQTIAPSLGEKQFVPGSATADHESAKSLDQRMPITARHGAPGVYVAYCAGYPICKSVNVWRSKDKEPIVVAKGDARLVNIAPGPEGHLWVMWSRGSRLYASRSNRAATRFGAIVPVPPPKGTDTVWKVDGEGSNGPLDLLVAVSATSSGLATWHTQVFPPLTLVASPKSFLGTQGATVHFTVLDVDDPVAGTTIAIEGKSLTTDAQGHASITFPKASKPGRLVAKASKKDYSSASTAVSVMAK